MSASTANDGATDYNDDNLPDLNQDELMRVRDRERVERMRFRKHKKGSWLLYPEDQNKVSWDLFITFILMISCILTPYNIAFIDDEPLHWKIINFTIDSLFAIDIIVIFQSCYYDDEFVIVENRWMIAKEYLKSWFIIDLVAILPFDVIFKSAGANSVDMIRLARMGRMYKMIKMAKILRVLKIIKQRSQLLKYLSEFLKIGLGFERLFFFAIIFFVLCHILTCIWIITPSLVPDDLEEGIESWMDPFQDKDKGELYLTSMYYTVTTMTTVGYGDISGTNALERAVSIIIMLVGVIAFSFATGSLTSILSNYDQANAKLQEKISILNRVYKDFALPLELYERLR